MTVFKQKIKNLNLSVKQTCYGCHYFIRLTTLQTPTKYFDNPSRGYLGFLILASTNSQILPPKMYKHACNFLGEFPPPRTIPDNKTHSLVKPT